MKPISIIACLGLAACAPAAALTPAPTGTSGPAPRPPSVPVTRSGAECTELLARYRAQPDSFTPSRPEARGIVVPPHLEPRRSWTKRTLKVHLLVDEQGSVVADSTRIDPAFPAGSFDRTLRESFSKYRFDPAVLDGCAVPAHTTMELTMRTPAPL